MIRTKLSLSDEWETPQDLFEKLCERFDIHPQLDVAATFYNRKCEYYIPDDHYGSSLNDEIPVEWLRGNKKLDVWCNPPNSKTKAFVLKAHKQWLRHNINIMMLVPCGVISRKYFRRIWDVFVEPKLGVEVHPVDRPSFIHPEQEKRQNAMKDYIVIIWRRRL